MRDWPGARQPHSSIVTLRATCSIQASSGWGVTPATWICRLPRCRKNRTSYVTSPPNVHTRADALFPRRGGLALWRWGNPMAFQEVAHRLRTDGQAQVGQGTDKTVIAPGAVFLGHADDQSLELGGNFGTAWGLSLGRTVTLLGDEFPVPGEDGGGFDDGRHCLERLFAQLVADFGQRRAFAICQPHTTSELMAQEAILCHQILSAQQQCLLDGPRDICQQVVPVHRLPLSRCRP